MTREIPCMCVDDLVRDEAIDRLEILLVDTQGAELAALEGAVKTIEAGKLRFVLLSTHHHSISHDPILHQRCLQFLKKHGAHIITEHSVAESYSGDGLILASFFEADKAHPPDCDQQKSRQYQSFPRVRVRLGGSARRNTLDCELGYLQVETSYGTSWVDTPFGLQAPP